MIFFPEKAFYEEPEQYGFRWQDVFVETSDQVKIHGWFLQAGNEKGVILFLHGNAGNISGRLFKAKGWVDRGISVLLIDYRSYGKSEGEIKHGEDIVRDAEAAYQWLVQEKKTLPEDIIFYGESLGSYPAIRLASEKKAAALILEAPYTSFVELGSVHYGLIPEFMRNMLVRDFSFPNREEIPSVKVPIFMMHGTADQVCPYKMGEELFKLAPQPKSFFSVPGGGHNDLPMIADEDYWEKPYRFVNRYL
ncbi:MAG: alpha/beta hydrolase [Candidatus Omnitrophica bacterium]|nr:alpha/beta hydrolase [Candidatus Omnitrophota bacterium]